MTRGGRDKTRDRPERRCIVTGRRDDPRGLVRFVIGPDGEVAPDILERLPGHGFWVTPDRATLDLAVRKRAFSRAARQQVEVPPDLADRVETALSRRVVDLLSLARKAGQAVAGYEKVKGWLDTGQAIALLQASDGSARGKTKLRPPEGPGSHITVLTGAELGRAFGRENVIHGALAGGGLTARVIEEAARLGAMRAEDGGDRPVGKGTTTT